LLTLSKYSFGIGDRFGCQAEAQLTAFLKLKESGVQVAPVWNKSNREHNFVGSEPSSVYLAASAAVSSLNWQDAWHVDADHIQLKTVDRFLDCSDFFTIDVADFIGGPANEDDVSLFVAKHSKWILDWAASSADGSARIDRQFLELAAKKFLPACKAAGDIYRHIAARKGSDSFIAEVSMDETDTPQSPGELLLILAALSDEGVRLQTIAPKFTGRFNKGVDYVGDLNQFEREFESDIEVLQVGVARLGLPANLKLSVHSGSDKFSLYPIIRRCLKKTGAGIHVKTAGTTWLEELIGLSESGGDGLQLCREIYSYALDHIDELCQPYASVIDIDQTNLPSSTAMAGWSGADTAAALRHIPSDPRFNPDMRQLLHVSFKLAAKAGSRYLDLLRQNRTLVGQQVTQNLFDRHLKPLFLD
jgi:tagaturonate epimerase